MLKNNVECQDQLKVKVTMLVKSLDPSNIVCEYEVNVCLTKKVLEENETLTQIVNDTGRPPPDAFTNL